MLRPDAHPAQAENPTQAPFLRSPHFQSHYHRKRQYEQAQVTPQIQHRLYEIARRPINAAAAGDALIPIVSDWRALQDRRQNDGEAPGDAEGAEDPGPEVVGAQGEDAAIEEEDGEFDGENGGAPSGFQDELELKRVGQWVEEGRARAGGGSVGARKRGADTLP